MGDEFKPHSHVPYGSDGSGFYTDSTIGCFNVIRETDGMVKTALESIEFRPSDGAFTICDYGTADGGTSMILLHDVIQWLKTRYGDDCPVHVVYEDQPVNDFKSLFLRVHGLMPGPPSYYKAFSKVYVTAAGTGFFSQCVPDQFVHLGFSATALHWLSKRPGPLDDALHHVCSKNGQQVAAFTQQAALDWETILLHRAEEIKTGGQLVIASFCVDSDGNHLGKSAHIKCSMYDQMTSCWQEMLSEGKITQEEHDAAQFNNYYRSVEEYRAPFTEGAAVHKAGLRLVSIETKVVRCPYHIKWLEEGDKGDEEARRRHAQWFIPTTRVWSNFTFLSALNDARPEKERVDLVDAFYKKYEDRVAATPEDHGMDYAHAYIHIKKV